MNSQSIYFFPGNESASISEAGGKGLSLLLGSSNGLPVPPGFILSVNFFAFWFRELQTSHAWTAFLKAEQKNLETSCKELKQHALNLTFTKQQDTELSEALTKF